MATAGTRQRLSGWLALFALAIQLAVSFGHMHREEFVHGRPGQTVVTQGASGAGTPTDGDDDYLTCDICATVHMAGTLLVPTPPPIALPAEISIDRLTAAEHPAAPRPAALAFNARGPPSA
jgi:hypothetical protein